MRLWLRLFSTDLGFSLVVGASASAALVAVALPGLILHG